VLLVGVPLELLPPHAAMEMAKIKTKAPTNNRSLLINFSFLLTGINE
jgi:hypothetical protein